MARLLPTRSQPERRTTMNAFFAAPDFADRFVALDFETANAQRGSPCSVGLAFVEDGKIVAAEEHLMRPPPNVEYFAPHNVKIHKITQQMVRSKPRFGELMPRLLDSIGDQPVVAHNAGFDMGVLREACKFSNLELPTITYLCTMVISRTILDLETYRLARVANELGLILTGHHNAQADAVCAAEIMLALCGKAGATTLDELLRKQKVTQGNLNPTGWIGCQKKYTGASQPIDIPGANLHADPGTIAYGKHFVITGKLPNLTKKNAYQILSTIGGQGQSQITRKTDYLVIGEWDVNTLRPGARFSIKYDKAMEYREKGQSIEILDGRDFVALLIEAQEQSRRS